MLIHVRLPSVCSARWGTRGTDGSAGGTPTLTAPRTSGCRVTTAGVYRYDPYIRVTTPTLILC